MKKLLLLILFVPFICFSQQEYLNQTLLKASSCYKYCADMIQVYQIMREAGATKSMEGIYKVYFFNSENLMYYDGFISGNGDGSDKWKTVVVFNADANHSYCVSFDPHSPDGSYCPYTVECSIMMMTSGQVYEVDYGYVTKNRIPSNNNTYLEEIVLKNGSKVIIQNKLWVKNFIITGSEKYFAIDYYPFLDSASK